MTPDNNFPSQCPICNHVFHIYKYSDNFDVMCPIINCDYEINYYNNVYTIHFFNGGTSVSHVFSSSNIEDILKYIKKYKKLQPLI